MACKIDETVKLIDKLIESEQWVKYNEKSGLKGDNKKLEEAIAKLKSFKSLKMQSQISKTPGSKDTEISREDKFNKYISDVFTDKLYNDITQLVKYNKFNDAADKIIETYNRIGLNDNYEYEDNVDTDNLRDDVKEYVSKYVTSSVLTDTTKLTQNIVNKLFKKVPGRNYEIQPGITASDGQKKLIDKGVDFLKDQKKASKIGENVMIVQGRGGTGKTSSISRVLINYINENSNSFGGKTTNILMMTLSHQAKDVLKGMSEQIFEETRVQPKVEVISGAMAWYATDDDIKSKSIVFEDKKISYENKDKNRDGSYKSSVASAVSGDIIVVDEASMLDSAELAYLLEKTKEGIKVILMGDYHQAKIVDPKTEDFSASGSTNTGYSKVFDHFTGVKDPLLKNAEVVELTEIHRQKEGSNILDFADYYADIVDYDLGNIKVKPTAPIANGNEVEYINRSDIVDSFVSDYNKGKSTVYIAHSNKDVTIVNKAIRQKLSKNPKDEYSVGDMMIAYSNYSLEGDGPIITNSERLIVKKIDDATEEEKSKEKISQKVGFSTQEFKYKKDVKIKKLTLERVNGDSSSIPVIVFVPSGLLDSVISKFKEDVKYSKNFDSIYKSELIKLFEPANGNNKSLIRNDSLTSVSAGAGLSYGYAVTAHKSQGSTVDIVYTTLSTDPNVSYVAVTRAREKVYIVDNAKANISSSNSGNNEAETKTSSSTPTPGSESKKTNYEIVEKAIVDKINKLKNNYTFFGEEYDKYMIDLEKFLDKLLTEKLKSMVIVKYSKDTAFNFIETGVAGSFNPKYNIITLPDFDSLLLDKEMMDKLIKKYSNSKNDITYEFISEFLDAQIGNIDGDHKMSSLIHERVHSVVSKWLSDENNEDHQYFYEINDLFTLAKNKFEKLSESEQNRIGHYWKKDIHEFAAEGLSSKNLVEFLRGVETESKSDRSGNKTTLLDELFNIVSKIYKNITGKNIHNSLLTVIVKIAENKSDIEMFNREQSNLAATEAYTSNKELMSIGSAIEYGAYLRENYTDVYTHVGESFDIYDNNKTITDRKQFGNYLYVSDLSWSPYWKQYRFSVLDNKMEEWANDLGLDPLIDYNLIKEKNKKEYERLSKNEVSYYAINDKNPKEVKTNKDLSIDEIKDIIDGSFTSITEIGGINPYNDISGGVKQKAVIDNNYIRLGSKKDIEGFRKFVKDNIGNDDFVYMRKLSSTKNTGSESEVQSYKQFSKDDIEAAKDIMAKNKKECE